MTRTRESRPRIEVEAANTNQAGKPSTSITRSDRRTLKQARRALGAALAQAEHHPDLVAAAGLVIEAGRSQ